MCEPQVKGLLSHTGAWTRGVALLVLSRVATGSGLEAGDAGGWLLLRTPKPCLDVASLEGALPLQ